MTGEAPLKAAIHRSHNSARNHAPLVREYALTPQVQRVLAQRDEPKARAAVSRLVPQVEQVPSHDCLTGTRLPSVLSDALVLVQREHQERPHVLHRHGLPDFPEGFMRLQENNEPLLLSGIH
jgi:hypothetical protein